MCQVKILGMAGALLLCAAVVYALGWENCPQTFKPKWPALPKSFPRRCIPARSLNNKSRLK